MKMKNIVVGLLLVAVSQAAYAVENRIWNNSSKPVRITFVYKNNKQEVRTLEQMNPNTKKADQLLILTTKANPIKEIFFSYIGTVGLWSVSIDSIKNIDEQGITLLD